MPNCGGGYELKEAGPDNRIYLLVNIRIMFKYNTQVLRMWFDVGGKKIEVLSSNSGMVSGAKD